MEYSNRDDRFGHSIGQLRMPPSKSKQNVPISVYPAQPDSLGYVVFHDMCVS